MLKAMLFGEMRCDVYRQQRVVVQYETFDLLLRELRPPENTPTRVNTERSRRSTNNEAIDGIIVLPLHQRARSVPSSPKKKLRSSPEAKLHVISYTRAPYRSKTSDHTDGLTLTCSLSLRKRWTARAPHSRPVGILPLPPAPPRGPTPPSASGGRHGLW